MSEIKCQRIVKFMQTTEVEKTDRQDEIWSLEPDFSHDSSLVVVSLH